MNLASGKKLIKTNYQVSRYVLQTVSNQLINRKDDRLKREKALEITANNATQLLGRLNFKVEPVYSQENLFQRNYFMVCNHMSYLDILVISSIHPAVFVTSVEMEKTFFLGDIAKLGGSFFVDRVNRRKMKQEVEALITLLKQNFNVFIFPEGTSTNGAEILPFKKSLFRVPYQTNYPILPICLKYKSINGEEFSTKNCDRICWYDDMTFASHLLQLMGVHELKAEVHYLNPLDPKDFDNHGDLAQTARESIVKVYDS